MATRTWLANPVTGDFSTAANWDIDPVPVADDDAAVFGGVTAARQPPTYG